MSARKRYTPVEKAWFLALVDKFNYAGGEIPANLATELNDKFNNDRQPKSLQQLYYKLTTPSLSKDDSSKQVEVPKSISATKSEETSLSVKDELLFALNNYDSRIETLISARESHILSSLQDQKKSLDFGWGIDAYANLTFMEISQNEHAQSLLSEVNKYSLDKFTMILARGKDYSYLILPLGNDNILASVASKKNGAHSSYDGSKYHKQSQVEQVHNSVALYSVVLEAVEEQYGYTPRQKKENWNDLVALKIFKPTKSEDAGVLEDTISVFGSDYLPKIYSSARIKVLFDDLKNYSTLK